ncbi:DUF4229 domain-containing protein [Gordonia sp. OPL2]|nr:DUF4229 domain-containing protein [Gordonia sp. OPL2]
MDTRRTPRYSNGQQLVKRVQRPQFGRPDRLECANSGAATALRSTSGCGSTLIAVSEEKEATAGSVALSVALYTLARLALVVVVAAIIMGVGALFGVEVPLLVAAVFGVLIALPLGLVLFKSLRLRVNRQIAAVDDSRKKRHDDLQSRLRGQSD